MTYSPFVGREGDLGVLTSLLRAGVGGDGGVVLVEGAPGIGKTRLVEEALAGAGDLTVLSAAAREHERRTSYSLLARAVGGDVTADALRSNGADALGTIVDVIDERSAFGGVVVVLEDVHWADHASARGLWVLSRHVAHLPVVLVATYRSWPRTPVLEATIDRLLAEGATRLQLGPLAPAAARALLAGVADDDAVDAAVAAADGNPLLLTELAEAFRRAGGSSSAVSNVRTLVLEPLDGVSAEAADLVRVAAALGSSVEVPYLAAVTGKPVIDLVPLVVELIEAGLLIDRPDRLEFRSPVVRDAVYDATPVTERAELHRRAGRALASSGAPAAAVGTQLAAAGDPDAVDWLHRAAADLRSTAPEVAIDLLTSAAGLQGNAPERDRTMAELVAPLARAGRVHEAITLGIELLARGRLGRAELDVRSGLALAYERLGDRAEAAEEWTAAANLAGVEPARRASLLGLAAYARLLQGDQRRAEQLALEAYEGGRRLGATEPMSIALTTQALLAGASGHVGDAVELAEEAVVLQADAPIPWLGASTARHHLGLLLLDADDFDRAGEVLAEGRRTAGVHGSASYVPFYYWELASRALLMGRLDDAEAEAEAGLALADETGTRLGNARAHALLARVALHRGDFEGAREHLSRAEGDTSRVGRQLGVELVGWTRGLMLQAQGDLDAALQSVLEAWNESAPMRWFRSYRLLGPTLASMLATAGDRERAHDVAEVVAEGARRSGLAAARGAALRARGHAAGDVQVLVEAVEGYAAGPRPLELASAHEEAGLALLAARDRRRGSEHLRAARRLFEDHRATGDVARVRQALRAHGIRASRTSERPETGWGSLTPTELRVAGLVADGLSNRRVADELFLSRYTVETHLKRVFSKLGVSSRVELAWVARRELEPDR